jgi:hypothetical protein
MLPNFFLIGAQKGGTSSLYEYVRQHPQIYFPPIKEPTFHAREVDPAKFVGSDLRNLLRSQSGLSEYLAGPLKERRNSFVFEWGQYQALYRDAVGFPVVGDASANYLASTAAPASIREAAPGAKIVAVLRHPADRALSAYRMHLANGAFAGTLGELIDEELKHTDHGLGRCTRLIEHGKYGSHVARYLETFPAEQVRIYRYEQFSSDPDSLIRDVFNFLGVDNAFKPDRTGRFNVSQQPRFPALNRVAVRFFGRDWFSRATSPLPRRARRLARKLNFDTRPSKMSPVDRSRLIEIYRDDIGLLSKLLKTDYSDWLK